jgi:1,2-diacylglycerol-3-alpha-glucose alpha-1,2-galactosyltransferase
VHLPFKKEACEKGFGIKNAYFECEKLLKASKRVHLDENLSPKTDVIHFHTFDVWDPRPFLIALLSRKKIVMSAHIIPDTVAKMIPFSFIWLRYFKMLLRIYLNRADVVIAVSNATRDVCVNDLKVEPEVVVVPNLIDISRFRTNSHEVNTLRKELGFGLDDFIIVSSGHIQPRKRFDIFIETAKMLPRFKFVWIGDIMFKYTSDYKKLKAMIDNPPENVTVTGILEPDDVAKWTKLANVIIFPSDQETFGLAIVEGAATLTPVVARNLKDYDATFGDKIIRCNDVADFVNEIQRLYDDPECYNQYVQKSAQIAEKYDSAVNGDELVNIYERLCYTTDA